MTSGYMIGWLVGIGPGSKKVRRAPRTSTQKAVARAILSWLLETSGVIRDYATTHVREANVRLHLNGCSGVKDAVPSGHLQSAKHSALPTPLVYGRHGLRLYINHPYLEVLSGCCRRAGLDSHTKKMVDFMGALIRVQSAWFTMSFLCMEMSKSESHSVRDGAPAHPEASNHFHFHSSFGLNVVSSPKH